MGFPGGRRDIAMATLDQDTQVFFLERGQAPLAELEKAAAVVTQARACRCDDFFRQLLDRNQLRDFFNSQISVKARF